MEGERESTRRHTWSDQGIDWSGLETNAKLSKHVTNQHRVRQKTDNFTANTYSNFSANQPGLQGRGRLK